MHNPTRKIEDYLFVWAEKCPHQIAVACGSEELTYAKLAQEVVLRKEEFQRSGLNCKNAMVVRSSQDIDFLITYLAVHLLDGVMVPLESSISDETLHEVLKMTEHADIPSGTADILFTTGTTGKRKGVIISHEAILANAENLIDAHEFKHDLAFIISGPLNHIGSLSKIWPTLIVGGTIYITEGMKDINTFLRTIERPDCLVATFLVPASIKMLLTFGKKQLAQYIDKIDFIETGAAPISQQDMEALCKLLPHTRLYNTYASTETGIICTHNYNTNQCWAGCLGKPMKNSSVTITNEGIVACSGKTLMTGYLNDEKTTKEILKNGIIYTHDQGYIDEYGYLHLAGRKDDIINVGGFKVNPIEIENVALTYQNISDCICVPDTHPVLGTVLRLIVVTHGQQPLDKRGLASFLTSKLEHYKVPHFYTQVEKLHRTYNGKLDRKAYLQDSC